MSTAPRICSKTKCRTVLPPEDKFKTCIRCRAQDLASKHRKRHPTGTGDPDTGKQQPPTAPSGSNTQQHAPEIGEKDSDSETETPIPVERFANAEAMFTALREHCRQRNTIDFNGEYTLPIDPLVSDKERVQMTMQEAWKVTGYRFTVNYHRKIATGHKTRAWCSQDAARKKVSKPKQGENVKHRDNVGMCRFECQSHLAASCKNLKKGNYTVKLIGLRIRHHGKHIPYYDVSMPVGASQIILENLEWSTPSSLIAKIQAAYPNVTAGQVRKAWTVMSAELWQRDPKQIDSAQKLLLEHQHVVDIFEVAETPGVEQICWGLKIIAEKLTVKHVAIEIAIDATYNTNSMHLELYCVMAEFDNAGFPLSYCLLSTTQSIHPHKRIDALERWTIHLRDKYHVKPKFINLDKDLGEIGMAQKVWPDARIQICGWHMTKAVRERISKAKLSTTPYKASEAHKLFPFIDESFTPPGRPDLGEREGGREGGGRDNTIVEPEVVSAPKRDPNALYIHLPVSQKPAGKVEAPTPSLNPEAVLKIKIPAANRAMLPNSTPVPVPAKRVFCPPEHQKLILEKMEEHRNAHPLLPGKAAPTPEGIYAWAVKRMYYFCQEHDLRELWAYLWENWYRPERWRLWARAVAPEIPRLNTTMIMESHWRHIKHDFLHHFSKPRIDLLAWILVTKLAPSYYRKLDLLLGDIGRYREPCAWRKPFKRSWRICEKAHIPEPTGTFEYRTDVRCWVCTCPALAKSRFLICKHLVQGVKPVPPEFFLEVTRNRTAPVWSHPSLVPLDDVEELGRTLNESDEGHGTDVDEGPREEGNATDDEDEYLIEAEQRLTNDHTYQERMTHLIRDLRSFADGLTYQMQFRDERFLTKVETQGRGFLNMINTCLEKERRENSSRSRNPETWNAEFASAMFYRSRPRAEASNN